MNRARRTSTRDDEVLPEGSEPDIRRFRPARDAVRKAFREKPLRSTGTFVRSYVLTLLPLSAALAVVHMMPSVLPYVIAAVIAGFTQNALGILLHEGSHYFFHSDKNKNDLLADFLVGLPIFNTVEGYRWPHVEHHRHSGKERDPYYELYGIYQNRRALVFALIPPVPIIGETTCPRRLV